jgi:hypothetical protein
MKDWELLNENRFSCAPGELSCIIGSLFLELEPPHNYCVNLNPGCVVLSGTTYLGGKQILTITPYGFTYSGDTSDIQRIRERRCEWQQR